MWTSQKKINKSNHIYFKLISGLNETEIVFFEKYGETIQRKYF